jgi:hypothetical protein
MSIPDRALLQQAAADMRYLLNRGYPRAASLNLVGNRYALPRKDRQILHRGVFADDVAQARRAKIRSLSQLAGQSLALDGHNVLITLESALMGRALVAADDGFIRDVAELSGAYRHSPATRRALGLLAGYLARHAPGPVTVLYDAPLAKSGELARETRDIFQAQGLAVTARAVAVPERELIIFPGAVATSDTHLIDARDVLMDLAGEIIRQELPDLAPPISLSTEL